MMGRAPANDGTWAMNPLLRRLLFGGSTRLRDHERRMLDCFGQALPDEARRRLEAQLGALRNVQRFAKGKMVTFHLKEEPASEDLLFPNRSPELYAARLRVKPPGQSLRITCDLVAHRGRISSLEFSRPPDPVQSGELECGKVEVLEDLLAAARPAPAAAPAVALGENLKRLASRGELSGVEAPAPEVERVRFLERLGAAVPNDYVRLLAETNGFEVGGFRFLGTRARRIVYPDSNYQLLAEDGQTALAVREGQEFPTLLVLDQIYESVREAGASFVDAFLGVRERPREGSD